MDEDRNSKVLLFVLDGLNALRDRGLVDGPGPSMTDKGREEVARLRAEGFSPTEEETESAMEFILSGGLNE